jgi:hypothetical protein
MRHPNGTSRRPSPSGLLGRYVTDLNRWARRIITGYALTAAILVMGGCSILVALGVGAAALFHWLEVNYGPYVAYGGLGGFFLLLGIVCIIVGLQLLKRSIPPVPALAARSTRFSKPLQYQPLRACLRRCTPATPSSPTKSPKPWPARPRWCSSDGSQLLIFGAQPLSTVSRSDGYAVKPDE